MTNWQKFFVQSLSKHGIDRTGIIWGDQTMQMYGKFEGFPRLVSGDEQRRWEFSKSLGAVYNFEDLFLTRIYF